METNFYTMKTKPISYTDVIIDNDQTVTKKCPMCGSVLGERKYDKYKLRFWGTREGDLLFSPDCHIVSFNLLKLLYDNKVSGFLENEIDCTGWDDRKGKRLQKDSSSYRELIITGRAGYLKNMEGIEIPKCPKCGAKDIPAAEKEKGFIVDEEWDGSDMFYFKNWPGMIIITEKVRCLLEKNKMKNVRFTILAEYTFS